MSSDEADHVETRIEQRHAAAPPSPAMNSRRFMQSPEREG